MFGLSEPVGTGVMRWQSTFLERSQWSGMNRLGNLSFHRLNHSARPLNHYQHHSSLRKNAGRNFINSQRWVLIPKLILSFYFGRHHDCFLPRVKLSFLSGAPLISIQQVKPLMALSTAHLEAMEDAGSDFEGDGPSDATLYDQAHSVCSSAIQNGGMLQKSIDTKLLRFLQEHQLVEVGDDGIILTRDAVRHGISASNAKLERSVRGKQVSTTLEIQTDLGELGWQFTTCLKEASIEQKVAILDNPSLYYELIRCHASLLLEYEQAGFFHHKQGDAYYKTMELAMSMGLEYVVEIPAYKKADFYAELTKFLKGESASDPRENHDQHKPKRTMFWRFQCCIMNKGLMLMLIL